MAGGTDRNSLELVLAEFNALRGEILARLSAQTTIIGVALTAVGVVIGLIVEKDADDLLFVLPILVPALGLHYTDHDRSVALIGEYLRTRLSPSSTTTGDLSGWERFLHDYRGGKIGDRWSRRSYLVLKAVPIGPFGAVAIAPLAITLLDGRAFDSFTTGLLWIVGLMLTIMYGAVAWLVARGFRDAAQNPPGDPSKSDRRAG